MEGFSRAVQNSIGREGLKVVQKQGHVETLDYEPSITWSTNVC